MCGRFDLDLGVEKSKDALRRRHRALEDVELLRKIANGTEELLRILDKRDEAAERQSPEQKLSAAIPNDEAYRDGAQDFHDRIKDRVMKDGLDIGFRVLPVELTILTELALFLTEELHDLHPDDVLLDEGVQHGDTGSHFAVDHPNASLENHRHHKQRR